jgi:cell pole-organizing protein PopZ
MSRPEKAIEPSMEEILASIRKIIAEEPIGSRSGAPLDPAALGVKERLADALYARAGAAKEQARQSGLDEQFSELADEQSHRGGAAVQEARREGSTSPGPESELRQRSSWLFSRSRIAAASTSPSGEAPSSGAAATEPFDVLQPGGRAQSGATNAVGQGPRAVQSVHGPESPARPRRTPGSADLGSVVPGRTEAPHPSDYANGSAAGTGEPEPAPERKRPTQGDRGVGTLTTPAARVTSSTDVGGRTARETDRAAAEVSTPAASSQTEPPAATCTPEAALAAKGDPHATISTEAEVKPQVPVGACGPVAAAGSALDVLAHGLAVQSDLSRVRVLNQPVPLPPEGAAITTSSGARTLEDAVADLLRPMLRQWLDSNMPGIIEKALRSELSAGGRPGAKSDQRGVLGP